MASTELVAEISAFMDTYSSAFLRFDQDAIADHYVLPVHFVSDAAEVALRTVATEETCRAAVEPVLNWHRKLGVVASRRLRFDVVELSPRMVCLDLAAEFQDSSGAPLYDYRGLYTLVRKDGGWRVATISHNQIPRLLDCLSRRRASA